MADHQAPVVLGVSLGTRWLGLSVGFQSELIFWQMKMFPQTYSKKKVKKIWRAIETTIDRYGVKVIGMKIPLNYARTEGMSHCLEFITESALRKDIVLYFYDIQTIEGHFIKSGKLNKMALAENLANKHSELKKEYFKLSKSQQNIKMFEAVAVMELAILELP